MRQIMAINLSSVSRALFCLSFISEKWHPYGTYDRLVVDDDGEGRGVVWSKEGPLPDKLRAVNVWSQNVTDGLFSHVLRDKSDFESGVYL